MLDAMSCGAVVLGSATPPVVEIIRDGENGLLAEFFDIEGMAEKAVSALKDPAAYRPLGGAAEQMIAERYSLDAVLPEMTRLYEDASLKKSNRATPYGGNTSSSSGLDPTSGA
jgi:glycosyltransferase involved in cell wall biosynthesis